MKIEQMKKLRIKLSHALYTLLFVVVFTACKRGDELKNANSFKNYEVIEIDGCEYIQYGTAYGFLEITHKGNCKNKIHDCN